MKPDLILVQALVLAITAPDDKTHAQVMQSLVQPVADKLTPEEIKDCNAIANAIVSALTVEAPKIIV